MKKLKLKTAKEDQKIFIKKVFRYNLVGQNHASLNPDEVWGENIETIITKIGIGVNKGRIWSRQGWEISDLIKAGLVYEI